MQIRAKPRPGPGSARVRAGAWSATCMKARRMSITALLSKDDGTDEPVDLADWNSRELSNDELLWIDVDAAEDVARRRAGVATLATPSPRGSRRTQVQPVAHVHDGAVEVAILGFAEDLDADPQPVRILAGEGWVITRHARPGSVPRRASRADPGSARGRASDLDRVRGFGARLACRRLLQRRRGARARCRSSWTMRHYGPSATSSIAS